MKLEMIFYRIGVGVRLDKNEMIYHEVWMAKALKIAWKIWIGLGWENSGSTLIKAKEWLTFTGDESKLSLMDKIARFNRISRAKNLDFQTETFFKDGWILILEIISGIKILDSHFELCEEIAQFRGQVTRFIAYGIKRGFDTNEVGDSEHFLYMADDYLNDQPIVYSDDLKVSFFLFPETATATVTCQKDVDDPFECENISVEI